MLAHSLWFIAFALTGATTLRAEDPVAPIRTLIPPGTSICFVIRDAGPQLRSLADSPMARWFAASALGKQILKPEELDKLGGIKDFVSTQLGVTLDEVRDDILGDAVVFAYQSPLPGKPDTEAGTLIVRPRKLETLRRLIDRVNKLQLASGEIKPLTSRGHGGATYTVREKVAGGTEFYRLGQGLFIFSNREATLQEILAAEQAPKSAVPKWLTLDDRHGALVALFNPRTFDAAWAARAAETKDAGEKALLTNFAKIWAATDGLAVAVRLDSDLNVALTAEVNDAKLPAEWRALRGLSLGQSTWTGDAPGEAILAVQGRFRLREIVAAVAPFFPDDGKEFRKLLDDAVAPAVGREQWPAVLDKLGPGFGFWITPPNAAARTPSALPGFTLAVQLGASAAEHEALAGPIKQALDTLAHAVRVEYNRTHADQITIRQTGPVNSVTVLENPKGFADGYAPSYRVEAGWGLAVAGSQREACERNLSVTPTSQAANPAFATLSLTRLRNYLQKHGEALSATLAESSKRPRAEVTKEIAELANLLSAGESVDLHVSGTPTRVEAKLTIRFVKPLKK